MQLESRRNEVLVSQKGVEEFTRDIPVLGGNELGLEEQKLWQMQKEVLEKELYDVSVVPLCPSTMFSKFTPGTISVHGPRHYRLCCPVLAQSRYGPL